MLWIHGRSKNNSDGAFDALFDILAKRCKVHKMTDYVPSQKKLTEQEASCKRIFPHILGMCNIVSSFKIKNDIVSQVKVKIYSLILACSL